MGVSIRIILSRAAVLSTMKPCLTAIGTACSIFMATSKKTRKFTDIVYELGFRLCDIMHQEDVIPCFKVDDIYRAHRENKIALAMGRKYGDGIENEVDRIEILYRPSAFGPWGCPITSPI